MKQFVIDVCDFVAQQLLAKNIPILPIDVCCILTKTQAEFDAYYAANPGIVVEDEEGPIIQLLTPWSTALGPLTFLKIRRPDTTKPWYAFVELASADYDSLKVQLLAKRVAQTCLEGDLESLEMTFGSILVFIPRLRYSDSVAEQGYQLE